MFDDLFGTPDTGPSADEIRQTNIDNAKQREKDVRAAAQKINKGGASLLFSPTNPALNIPGGESTNG